MRSSFEFESAQFVWNSRRAPRRRLRIRRDNSVPVKVTRLVELDLI